MIIGRDNGAGGVSEDANDVLAANSGSNLSFNSGDVLWSNTNVGSYTNSGGKLSITFNSNANTSAVQGVLNNIVYSHAISTPGGLDEDNVTLRLIFNDQNSNTATQGLGGGNSEAAGSGQDQGVAAKPPQPERSTSRSIACQFNHKYNSLNEGITNDVSTTSGNVLSDGTQENDPDLDAVTAGTASLRLMAIHETTACCQWGDSRHSGQHVHCQQ